jgi:hypothetical protein
VENTRGPWGPQPGAHPLSPFATLARKLMRKDGTGGYPHTFNNREGFSFPNCPASGGDLVEFPILANGNIYGGGSPGAYRVIYQEDGTRNGIYCGLLHHPVRAPPPMWNLLSCADVCGRRIPTVAPSISARERGRGVTEERAEIGWKVCHGRFRTVIRLCFFHDYFVRGTVKTRIRVLPLKWV